MSSIVYNDAHEVAIGHGLCRLCGVTGDLYQKRKNTAHNYSCGNCGATLRFQALANGYLSRFAAGRAQSLTEAIRLNLFSHLEVLDFSLKGPIRRHLRSLPNFTNAYFYEDMNFGEMRDGIICQDITQMTFPDSSFDLVTTSDVMEHVDRPWEGFSEVHRVLKPGGSYVFTIPVRYPLRAISVTRATLNRETGHINHLLDPVYHVSGLMDKTLVFTDFGSDLFTELNNIGLTTCFIPTSTLNEDTSRFGVFIATKF